MLIRLLPDQVIKEWPVIKHAIQESTYEKIFDTTEAVRSHLREVLIGTMQIWAIVENDKFAGIGVSRFSWDGSLGLKRLEIYSLYSYNDVSVRTWVTCLVALRRFAESTGCKHIIALSDQQHVLDLAQKMNGNTEQHFIVFDV